MHEPPMRQRLLRTPPSPGGRATACSPASGAPWRPLAILLGLLLMVVAMSGCGGRTPAASDRAARQAAPAYPADAQTGPALDIVVVREGDEIHLANRTPRSYRGLQLWLNQQYVLEVDTLAIGTGNTLPLEAFTNRYGEPYPVGSFLRPERSRRLVLAELHDGEANVRYPLVVQPGPDEALDPAARRR